MRANVTSAKLLGLEFISFTYLLFGFFFLEVISLYAETITISICSTSINIFIQDYFICHLNPSNIENLFTFILFEDFIIMKACLTWGHI